jgi:alpha-mannosidase
MGYAFLKIATPDSADINVGDGTIENRHYRVKVDPRTGGLLEFLDKDLSHDFAGDYQGWRPGQYIYEEVDSPEGRLAINNYDFSHPDFYIGHKDTPWRRSGATKVTVGTPSINEGRAAISLDIEAPGIRSARVTYALDAGTKALNVDWTLDKLHNTDPEAVFVAFPFSLDGQDFTIDLNGIPARPNRDQLDGAAKDWYPLGRWVDVSDGQRGVTLVPLDAPLVHLGGITTGKWSRVLEPEGPTIMSWALNNHWMVNFKASQDGRIPLRYRLTTHDGAVDPAAAARFAAEVAQPPVVLRDIRSTGARDESFFRLANGTPITVTAKPGEDEGWVALRLQNLSPEPADAEIAFARAPKSAKRSDPIERGGQGIRLDIGGLTVRLDPLAIETVLVRFGD